jgi:SAM-dependent methyltransferase
VRSTVELADVEFERLQAILDFGCGCGRVARHWGTLSGPQFHGCDRSPGAVRWCQENLRFLDARINALAPPAPYGASTFDLIYCLSVFTHLTEQLQRAWCEEHRRIAKPAGLLLLSTHGDAYRERLPAAEQTRYDRGEVVVRYPRSAGTNVCSAHHPFGSMKELLERSGWDLVSFHRGAARGVGHQDLYLARASDTRHRASSSG